MSGLTPELALGTAVGSDDTANYLVSTLASALNVIDGEFSSATGHNHQGAHQGGALVFGVLSTTSIQFANGATLGPFSTGTTLRFQSINVTHSGNISADGNAVITGTLGVTGATTLGAATIGTLTVSGTISGPVTVGGLITANGGINTLALVASTVSTTGRITSGTDMVITNGTLYLHPSGDTVISRGGAGLVNIQSVALGGSLSVAGATTLNSTVNVPNNDVTVRGLGVVRSPRGDGRKIDFGSTVATSLISNGAVGVNVTFNQAFTSNPEVMVAISDVSGGGGTLDRIGVGRSAITTSGFQMTFKNGDASTQTIFGNWIAIGN